MTRWRWIWLALALAALPVVVRYLSFYRGGYTIPQIPEVEAFEIGVPAPEHQPRADGPTEGGGLALVDLSHRNNLQVDDLAPLFNRLAARGLSVQTFDGFDTSLPEELRAASALLVVAPTTMYSVEERDAVLDFAQAGGRVLLAADPTRPVESPEEAGFLDFFSILFPTSAVPAVNSLASAFGVVYFDDYLYNLVENEGNYRNVRFTRFAAGEPLVGDVEELVLFATHSVQTDAVSLIRGDRDTLSPVRIGETGLTAAALAADGRVLALGDLTSLSAPFHNVADNDQFLSNIADWLATSERRWTIREFPFVFGGPVDLIQISQDSLDPRLIAEASFLESVLQEARLSLRLGTEADLERDTLFVGTFDAAGAVEEHLAAAGVRIPEGESEGEEPAEEEIIIEGVGAVSLEGTTLYALDRGEDRVVLVALAEDGEVAVEALGRLASLDFFGCVHGDSFTLCSTGEGREGEGLDAGPVEPVEPGEDSEPTDVALSPKLGSLAESEDAFESGVPWLENLAPESYETNSQAGETYLYTIVMEESTDAMWVYGWCAVSQETLEENWQYIGLEFFLNGENVSLTRFVRFEESFGDLACRLHYVLLSDWPPADHFVETEVTFTQEIDDGLDVYPAGTHLYLYE
ncbi:MAG: hypothetical protein ACE5NC_09440, partial [Anaerolineae bacterium]